MKTSGRIIRTLVEKVKRMLKIKLYISFFYLADYYGIMWRPCSIKLPLVLCLLVHPRSAKVSVITLRSCARGALALLFVLGATWTFGVLHILNETTLTAYLFTITNAFQGMFIFIFLCVLSRKVTFPFWLGFF